VQFFCKDVLQLFSVILIASEGTPKFIRGGGGGGAGGV
jgi:hypothetical protein